MPLHASVFITRPMRNEQIRKLYAQGMSKRKKSACTQNRRVMCILSSAHVSSIAKCFYNRSLYLRTRACVKVWNSCTSDYVNDKATTRTCQPVKTVRKDRNMTSCACVCVCTDVCTDTHLSCAASVAQRTLREIANRHEEFGSSARHLAAVVSAERSLSVTRADYDAHAAKGVRANRHDDYERVITAPLTRGSPHEPCSTRDLFDHERLTRWPCTLAADMPI